MAPFNRRKANEDPIGTFWSWWRAGGSATVAKAIADRQPDVMVGEISGRIDAIAAGLEWELGPGIHAEHVLTVTAAGNHDLRAPARRWLRAAPPADITWEYTDLRRPTPDAALTLENGAPMALSDALVAVELDRNAAAVHVGLHHPAFPDLGEQQRKMATYLMLDAAVGEEMVETWIGGIETLTDPPEQGEPLDDLLGVVAGFAREFVDENGDPAWALLQGRTPDGQPLVASVEIPLRSMRLPNLDSHVGVSVGFSPIRDDGLPEPPALDALRDLEGHLTGRLGDSGRLVAHETSGGRRLFHFYVDGATPAAEQLRVAAGGWTHGRVELDVRADPGWHLVRHLAG